MKVRNSLCGPTNKLSLGDHGKLTRWLTTDVPGPHRIPSFLNTLIHPEPEYKCTYCRHTQTLGLQAAYTLRLKFLSEYLTECLLVGLAFVCQTLCFAFGKLNLIKCSLISDNMKNTMYRIHTIFAVSKCTQIRIQKSNAGVLTTAATVDKTLYKTYNSIISQLKTLLIS